MEPSTIRRHIANVCKAFGFSNIEGEHYSYREELVDLFAQHRSELVHPQLVGQGKSAIEFPGSPLTLKSPLYVERPPIEKQCLQEIRKPGGLVRIRAPQHMGKTSLLHRILAGANEMNFATVRLNLRQAEAAVLTDLDTFLRWFCINLIRKLNLSVQIEDYWDSDRFGSLVSCTTSFQFCLLEQLHQNLVLGLDEVDWLFEFPQIAQGFFALLRSWHEEANNLQVWQRLRLVVAHSTEVYLPLNLNQSPFNVGLPIRLSELTIDQIQQLAKHYGWNGSAAAIQQIVAMVGGHPYLLQLAFYHLQQGMTLEELLRTAPTQAGIYRDHLRRHWQVLQNYLELQIALDRVIANEPQGTSLDPILAYRLESSGLARLDGNQVRLSCELYRRYFSDRS
ncbi:AAA-like domain-containing protein [Microcoleus sp. FACHB-1515]|uniref:AAA-like domain-containing protein n=1 Tax=Cyanophyceae TaxID=3028117 RepID=UPI0016829EE8|nr:AAA-like domain-containing protein [Microcoleus sp. FACHB-1515]MBD2088355.1 AAA-like domain-containing protein [Microcoleus sp. FACHB-1515]